MTDKSTTTAKAIIACATVAAALALCAAPAQGENLAGCRAKIGRAMERYDTAVDRYGRDSSRAEKERFKVQEIKQRCYEQFGEWWDPHGNRWHHEHW